MMRVLVVEDNALYIPPEGTAPVQVTVDATRRCEEVTTCNEHLPDIAGVDLSLPDEDGLSLMRRWRSSDVFCRFWY